MEASGKRSSPAWQPVTPRGVAAFANAPLGRLLLVQFAVALLAAIAVVWFMRADWFPVVTQALSHVPEQGQVRAQYLDWAGPSPTTLAENRYLALTVDLKHEGQARSPAHLQVEFGRSDFRIISLFGFCDRAYPRHWRVAANRLELQAWWGAWTPPLLAIAAIGTIAALMVSWTMLATVYALVAWLIGFFADRDLSFGGSWRLAGAAQMPGALLMSGAALAYGLGVVELPGFLVATGAHVVVGWVYVLVGPRLLPRRTDSASVKENPFKKTEY
jgi:hypothetical protein